MEAVWSLVESSVYRMCSGSNKRVRGVLEGVRGLFVCLYFETSHDQADAHPKAFLYPSFNSIRNTHVCHRLQPHLYPGLIVISLGRDV